MAARGQIINHCSSHRLIPSWVNTPSTLKKPFVLYVYVHPHSLSTWQSYVPNSPQEPSTLCSPQSSTAPAYQAQTSSGSTKHFPTAPASSTAMCTNTQDNLSPLCLWPTLQASTEKRCATFEAVCCPQIRGEEEDVFLPLPVQAQMASVRTVMYSTLSASFLGIHLGSQSLGKRDWGQDVPK